MKKRIFTEEEKAAILQDYNRTEMKVIDIRKKYGVSSAQMTQIIEEGGGHFRVPNNHKAKQNKSKNIKPKICPNCHRKIDIKGARYCPYCATDIRSEADILIEEVQTLYSYTRFLPADIADRAGETIIKLTNFLKKEVE